jgi:hypothetical protein
VESKKTSCKNGSVSKQIRLALRSRTAKVMFHAKSALLAAKDFHFSSACHTIVLVKVINL